MTTPLVSIVIPTWHRHDLLLEALANISDQSYPNIEVIIVSDGTDAELSLRLMGLHDPLFPMLPERVPTRLFELGRHWSVLLPVESIGVAPILAGLLFAHGEYLAWLCDDERFTDLGALTMLVDHLEATDADFVYPKVRMWRNGSSLERGWDIGTDPPEYGEFTWCLFRADLLTKAMPRFHGPTFNDADLMQRWMAAGARHAFLGRVLVTHRADR